jgi:hypothetical protein
MKSQANKNSTRLYSKANVTNHRMTSSLRAICDIGRARLNLAVALLMIAVAFVAAANAHAQAFVYWSNSVQYDNGFNPKVAYDGTTVVDVHNGTGGAGPLWYRVGQLNYPYTSIAFSNSHQYQAKGWNPSVALSGTTVVEVHNAGAGPGSLMYRVGTVNTIKGTIQWGKAYKYDKGFNPSVTMAGTTVVEAHNAGSEAGPEWYRVGTVDLATKTVAWSVSQQYDNGFNPSVSMHEFSDLTAVLEVHNGGNGAGPLWYRNGVVSGSTISWQNSSEYVSFGNNPTIGFNGGAFVEVHNGDAGGVVDLWDDSGEWLNNSLLWQESANYDTGMNPSVSLNPSVGYAVEVHNGTAGAGPLWCRIGTIEIIQ